MDNVIFCENRTSDGPVGVQQQDTIGWEPLQCIKSENNE